MTSALRTPAPQQGSGTPLKRVVGAAAFGQFVEFYDFVIYAYSAAVLGKLFFPTADPVASVLSVFGVYAVGFFMRPLGGIVFGLLGDKIGRRRLLTLVILLMGGATMAIGLIPSYQQIGILAPILLILCRMVQGFSAAGETIGSNAFVAEHAPAGKRGLYVAFTYSFSTVPSVVAALFVLLLTNVLGPESYESWGWRIAFLVGGPIALIGLYIRSKVDESPVFKAAQQAQADAVDTPRKKVSRPAILQALALASVSALAFYTLSGYMVTFLTSAAKLPTGQALLSNGIALGVAVVFFWIGGALTDRFGRKPIILGAVGAAILLYLPAFWLIGLGTMSSALVGQLIIAVVFGLYWGAIGVTIIELFPARNRVSAGTICWNMGFTVFGGTAPLISTWLISQTGVLVAPGIFMVALAVIAFVILLKLPETRGRDLLHAGDQSAEAATGAAR